MRTDVQRGRDTDAPAGAVDEAEFRAVLSAACQQVTVIGTRTPDGRRHGTTVTAFCSLSLRPPMVMIALDRQSRLLGHALSSRRLSVSLLGAGQEDMAMLFAGKGDDKGDSAAWSEDVPGVPFVRGASGRLSCELVEAVSGGDHVALFCLVTEAAVGENPLPLVYGKRVFGTNSALLGRVPAA